MRVIALDQISFLVHLNYVPYSFFLLATLTHECLQKVPSGLSLDVDSDDALICSSLYPQIHLRYQYVRKPWGFCAKTADENESLNSIF